MLKLFEYNKFSLINDISNRPSIILPHIKIKGNILYGSTDY